MKKYTEKESIPFQKEDFQITWQLQKNHQTVGELVSPNLKWHEEFEIKYITGGNGILQIGEDCIQVQAGDVVLINPLESHANLYCSRDFQYDLMNVNILFLAEQFSRPQRDALLFRYINGAGKLPNLIRQNDRIKQIIAFMFSQACQMRSNTQPELIHLVLFMLHVLLEEEMQEDAHIPFKDMISRREKIRPALEYIDQNFTQQCSVELLAEKCGFVEGYFSKLFKETMGISVKSYIDKQRKYTAEAMLMDKKTNISQVSAALGFSNDSYFYKWFKKHYGVTPQQYRIAVKLK